MIRDTYMPQQQRPEMALIPRLVSTPDTYGANDKRMDSARTTTNSAASSRISSAAGDKVNATTTHRSAVQDSIVEHEIQRMRQRVAEALNDPTGRLKLFVNGCMAPYIPDDVGRITTLREIYCGSNPLLTSLPTSISKLTSSLQVLDASNCSLTEIPEEFAQLRQLRVLKLSDNKLECFMWDAEQLRDSLEYLDLSNNNIQFFSASALRVFRALQQKEADRRKVQLEVEPSLLLARNPFLKPSHQLVSGNLSCDEQDRFLGEKLPFFVEDCEACLKTVIVGRPAVYVEFVKIELMEPDEDSTRAHQTEEGFPSKATSSNDHLITTDIPKRRERNVPYRLPIFHPVCRGNVECNTQIHKVAILDKACHGMLLGSK